MLREASNNELHWFYAVNLLGLVMLGIMNAALFHSLSHTEPCYSGAAPIFFYAWDGLAIFLTVSALLFVIVAWATRMGMRKWE